MKNKIKLDDYYHLEISGDCVTLVNEQEGRLSKKTGKMVFPVSKWHCTSMKNALNRYVDTSPWSCKSVTDILEKLDKLTETINNFEL